MFRSGFFWKEVKYCVIKKFFGYSVIVLEILLNFNCINYCYKRFVIDVLRLRDVFLGY